MSADLQERLTGAQQEATRLGDVLAELETKLAAAVKDREFSTAETLKTEVDAVRERWVFSEAQSRALSDVLGQVAREQAEREAAAATEKLREQARADYERATQAEQAATAELQRHLADVDPGLAAVQESLRSAKAAEERVRVALQAGYQALVALGEREPGMRIFGPVAATVRLERSDILLRIYEGTWNR
jgi:chromosome segregation ATPase